jgi:hypothetical protein
MEDILVNILTFGAGWILKQPRPLAQAIIKAIFKKKKNAG